MKKFIILIGLILYLNNIWCFLAKPILGFPDNKSHTYSHAYVYNGKNNPSLSFQFDKKNKLIIFQDFSVKCTYKYFYNKKGNIKAIEYYIKDKLHYIYHYYYDKKENRVKESIVNKHGFTSFERKYEYDKRGNIVSIYERNSKREKFKLIRRVVYFYRKNNKK